jgi:hypothetical protein
MTHLLVPLEASQTTAAVWVGIVGEAVTNLTLEVGDLAQRPIPDAWTAWTTWDTVRIRAQRLVIDGLEPGRRYPVRLMDGTDVRAQATATTLPQRLPGSGERPFTCLVGSCFGRLSDGAGAAGAAVARLPPQYRPDLTFLCGDQVYLDAPFARFLHGLHRGEELRADLVETYLATWTQDGPVGGFAQVLRQGATFMSSDDHELWNNAPNRTPAVLNTWFGGSRDEFRSTATSLYGLFGATDRLAGFRVGRLSFLSVDSRMERAADRSVLMPPERMARIVSWLDALDGPGVLVLGQPVLAAPAGWRGNLFDWGLPDFGQYPDLVRAIQRSRHDVVVLTGDVHFGRVAGCHLPSGAELFEVIASPFALVDTRLGRSWHEPPPLFPAAAIPGTVGCATWFEPGYRECGDHFATVAFSDVGSRVHMDVQAWPIPPAGAAPVPGSAWRVDLD